MKDLRKIYVDRLFVCVRHIDRGLDAEPVTAAKEIKTACAIMQRILLDLVRDFNN